MRVLSLFGVASNIAAELHRSYLTNRASEPRLVSHMVDGVQDLETDEELANVATVSAGNNSDIGDMICLAMQKVGRQGVVTMEESRTAEDNLNVVEGMQVWFPCPLPALNSAFCQQHAPSNSLLSSPYCCVLQHRSKLVHLMRASSLASAC